MDGINYHHLYYFWRSVQLGTIAAAADELGLTRPTITTQIRELEKSMGQPLLRKQGRVLVPTEFGRHVTEFAAEIFAVGSELAEFVKSGQAGVRQRLRIGLPDVVPKVIAYELIKPAFEMAQPPKIYCLEGKLPELLTDLAQHKLDLVISDAPVPKTMDFRLYNHKLGECGLSMMAVPALARKYSASFPQSLNEAPCLLPTEHTAVRSALDRWLNEHNLFPNVVGEFEDGAMLKVFGQNGRGVFPVPSAIESHIAHQYGVRLVGRIPDVPDRFYAISVEKRVLHEATQVIVQQARSQLFEVE